MRVGARPVFLVYWLAGASGGRIQAYCFRENIGKSLLRIRVLGHGQVGYSLHIGYKFSACLSSWFLYSQVELVAISCLQFSFMVLTLQSSGLAYGQPLTLFVRLIDG